MDTRYNDMVNVAVEATSNEPYSIPYQNGSFSSDELQGIEEKPSFGETFAAQFHRMNTPAQLLEGIDYRYAATNPLYNVKQDNWNPKANIEKFVNVRPQYQARLLSARNAQEQDFILSKIHEEQARDDAVANGSTLAWLLGGAAGVITDPMTFIPIASTVKYAKLSSSMMETAARSAAFGVSTGVLTAASENLDSVNGSLANFVTDAFVKSTFNTVLFTGIGAYENIAERMQLWNLNKLAKSTIDGVVYKFTVDEAGKLNGIKPTYEPGSLSAAQVDYHEQLAKSTFYKSGIFKAPYIGDGLIKLLGNRYFGSPLVKLLNSSSAVMRGIIDRVADHSIITQNIAEGNAAPDKFVSLMNKEFAGLRALSAQFLGLHLQRNGFNIENRLGVSAVDMSLGLYDKGLKLLGKETNKTPYTSRETFNDEVQHVLYSDEPSQHSAVNDAALLVRQHLDRVYGAYRKAYNLPESWLPPKTAANYLTRVYDTAFMNTNQDLWVKAISGWLKESDAVIESRMQPIRELETKIKSFKDENSQAFKELGIRELQLHPSRDVLYPEEQGTTIRKFVEPVKGMRETPLTPYKDVMEDYHAMNNKLSLLRSELENELRNNPELQLHVDDWNALSSDESKELKALLKPQNDMLAKIDEQKKVVSDLKKKQSSKLSVAKKQTTVEKAKPKAAEAQVQQEAVDEAERKLSDLTRQHQEELDRLQQEAHAGNINPRFFKRDPESFVYKFRNPEERLKFRETYESDFHREAAAKGYYDTIMNQRPEDTITQVMGKFTGNQGENPLKARTLLLPDKLLYDNKFLTNDLMAKVANYTSYLGRRTHLKNVFRDVSHDGGFEPVIAQLGVEHEANRKAVLSRENEIRKKLEKTNLDAKERKSLEKQLAKINKESIDKELVNLKTDFEKNKKTLNFIYEKMMGIQKVERTGQQIRSGIMSVTAWANLGFVPLTMITDLSAIGLQHGVWPAVRDGVMPMLESLGGMLKTKDSEALRNAAPHVHLALQDTLNGYADRNWSMHTSPYVNLGKTVNTFQHIAQLSANFAGTNYLDNFLQRMTSAVAQSHIMSALHDYKAGTIKKRDLNYLLKYGIDPKEWSDRMIKAFEQDGLGKTKLGGYQSGFWRWQDVEASNKFGDAVFRGVKDTQIQAGMLDVPMWLDDNGPLGLVGSLIRGFMGWGFASVNRYVVPSLQQADGEKLIGVMSMIAAGSLVAPMRRIARGEQPIPDDMTDKQFMYEALNNSGYMSFFMNIINDANLFLNGELLDGFKSDKYKDRTMAGFLGPSFGTANNMWQVLSAIATGEMNQTDAKKMARMIPFANTPWTWWMSKSLIDGLGLPQNRSEAKALKESNQ